MKVKIAPGAELDLLSEEELHRTLTTVLSGFARGPVTNRIPVVVALNSSGNTQVGSTAGPVPLFKVPSGYTFTLHRAAFQLDGYTFGVPYTSNSGYLEIQRAGLMMDGIPLTSPGLPRVLTGGSADGILFDNNETVDLLVVTGPASKSLQVVLQGTLEPLTVT